MHSQGWPQRRISNDQLLGELHRIYLKLKYFPSQDELSQFSKYALSTYRQRFGPVWKLEVAFERFLLVKELERRKDVPLPQKDDIYTRRPHEEIQAPLTGEWPRQLFRRKPGRVPPHRPRPGF